MAQKSIPIDRHVLRRIREIVFLRGGNTQALISAAIDAFIDDINGCQSHDLSRYRATFCSYPSDLGFVR